MAEVICGDINVETSNGTAVNFFGNTCINRYLAVPQDVLISTCKIFTPNDLTDLCFGFFYGTWRTSMYCRSAVNVGTAPAGFCSIFTGLELEALANDYIAAYYSSTGYYNNLTLGGFSSGNILSAGSGPYSFSGTTWVPKIYGQGVIPDAGKKWQGITISKWNGTVVSKINNV